MPRKVQLIFTGKPGQQVPGYPARDIEVDEETAALLVKNSGVYRRATARDRQATEETEG